MKSSISCRARFFALRPRRSTIASPSKTACGSIVSRSSAPCSWRRRAQRLRDDVLERGAARRAPATAARLRRHRRRPSSQRRDGVVGELGLVADGGAIDVRGAERRRPPSNDHLDDDRQPVLVLVQRRQVGRELLRQHREDLAPPCRPTSCCARRARRSRVPFGTSASTSAIATKIWTRAAGERLGDRELVEVARVVVVDRDPEALAQIAQSAAGRRRGGPADRRRARRARRARSRARAPSRPSPCGRSASGRPGRGVLCRSSRSRGAVYARRAARPRALRSVRGRYPSAPGFARGSSTRASRSARPWSRSVSSSRPGN